MTRLFHNSHVRKLAHVLLLVHCLLRDTTSSSFHFKERAFISNALRGGSVVTMERNNGTLDAFENGTSVFRDARAEKDPLGVTDQAVTTEATVSNATATDASTTDALGVFKPMKVLFLSADTGGGHRASAQSLMHQVRVSLELRFICCFYRLCRPWCWTIVSQSNIVTFSIYTFKTQITIYI